MIKDYKVKNLQDERIFSERQLNCLYSKLKENLEFKNSIHKKLLLGVFKRKSYKNFKRVIEKRDETANFVLQPTGIRPIRHAEQDIRNDREVQSRGINGLISVRTKPFTRKKTRINLDNNYE